jgi:hypothetical protein
MFFDAWHVKKGCENSDFTTKIDEIYELFSGNSQRYVNEYGKTESDSAVLAASVSSVVDSGYCWVCDV